MKIDVLEKLIRLIGGYYVDDDDSVIDELLDESHDLVREYEYPFRKELNINLLEMETKERKRDAIKYYIYEFKDPFGIFLLNKELLFTESDGLSVEEYNKFVDEGRFDLLPKSAPAKKLNRYEQYIEKAYELFSLIFDEIQVCCNKFEIDIWEVCEEVDFPIDFCDTGMSSSFIDDRNVKKQIKEIESTNSPTGSSTNDKAIQSINPQSEEKLKSFSEYLLFKDKNKLAESLKIEYKGKKGKQIKLMFEGLKRNNCIIIQNGEFKSIVDSLRLHFNWEIGSYSGINDYLNRRPNKEAELKEAEMRIKLIIQNIHEQEKTV